MCDGSTVKLLSIVFEGTVEESEESDSCGKSFRCVRFIGTTINEQYSWENNE